MTKCCFPGCEADSEGGGAVRGKPGIRFCREHFGELASFAGDVELQAAVVSALAVALPVLDKDAHPTAVLCGDLYYETKRLVAMQARRIQYLKLMGCDHVDEGVK
jgi:hypothetical protein